MKRLDAYMVSSRNAEPQSDAAYLHGGKLFGQAHGWNLGLSMSNGTRLDVSTNCMLAGSNQNPIFPSQSAIWNWARREGITDAPNPCQGSCKNREEARSIYIHDDDMDAIKAHASQPLTKAMLRRRFEKAREDAANAEKSEERAEWIRSLQFRDLRAKAGTDKADASGDIRQAQKQLGHTTISTTQKYMRNRRGEKVDPTK